MDCLPDVVIQYARSEGRMLLTSDVAQESNVATCGFCQLRSEWVLYVEKFYAVKER